jgi:2-octaprenyl-6-methoxyphenol hydroxylase
MMDYDILIVGGGMVGASLACALRDSGLKIGVVEAVPLHAAHQPSYDDRTVALAYGSQRIFAGLGLWDAIDQLGVSPIERIHISDRGRFGFTRLSAADAGLPALGYVVENRVLGAALLKTLQASANVEWLCPATLEAIELRAESAVIQVKIGETASRPSLACGPRLGPIGETARTLSARLVVAADGAHSAVRQAVGIAAARTEYEQTAVVTNVTISQPHLNTAYERFTETGPLALLPMRGNKCAVVWSARAGEVETILGWSDEEFLARLQDRFGERLGSFTRPGRRVAYPLALTRVREQVRPRLALIGNAAHTVHPVAGQGFNLGLRDVAALAEILIDAVRAGQDIGDAAVLKKYAGWRQRDNQVMAVFTNGLIRLFSNTFPPLVAARNLGLIAVDLMLPVKRRFIRVTSGLAGRLPRLARGLPL